MSKAAGLGVKIELSSHGEWGSVSDDHALLLGAGLLTATVSSEVFRAAQPALLYLVPFTLLPLLTMAYLKVSTHAHAKQ